MFRSDQKIYGYVKDGEIWKEFDSWVLMDLSDVEYRIWKDKYEKKIHVLRDEESALIYFNRGHRTYSYFSNSDKNPNSTSGPVSLSHVLRQKVISERKEAIFSLKNLIFKGNNEKKEYNIKFKKIYFEQEVIIEGEKYIPDLTIEFEEPAELALKWNNKFFIEVVECNETRGRKIEAFQKLPFGVIEIPYSSSFDILEKRKFSDITRDEVNELYNKIRNFYKKAIWADLIVDPTSNEYSKFQIDSDLAKAKTEVELEVESLKIRNQELLNEISILKSKIQEQNRINQVQKMHINDMDYDIRNQISINENQSREQNTLIKSVEKWNDKALILKMLDGFKIKS